MKMNLKEVFKQYKNIIYNDICEVEKLLDEKKFETIDFYSNDNNFDNFKIKHVLYYFEIPANISAEEICNVINTEKNKTKKKNDEFKLPKVNFSNAEIPNNKILYVGKSSGYFSTRLKQHIGNESKKTYALHLKEWNKMFMKEEIKLKLHYISFQDIMTEKNKHLLEIIETSLHYKLKPILGRTGH